MATKLRHLVESQERRKYTVKLSEMEHTTIQDLADRYAGGNLSEWLRYAGQKCRPPKRDLVPVPSER